MNFQDFGFTTDYITETQSFIYKNFANQDCEIKIKKYLPIEDKNDLITISLQKAEQNGSYNELLLEMYFHLNMIYLYTDIEFSMEDREDEFKLFDILESNNIINKVISVLGDEYVDLKQMLQDMKFSNLEYQNSAAAVIRKIITDLPANAAAAKEIVDSFNPQDYQNVIDFATAANGGRNINTQLPPISPAAQEVKEQKVEEKKPVQRKIVSIEKAEKKD